MDKWTEVEDGYLSNQPSIWAGRGKRIPDPDVEPTEMFLFCYDCQYTPKRRRISRKRRLHVLKGVNADDLESQLMDFTQRDDVTLIASPADPHEYINSGAEPVPLDPAEEPNEPEDSEPMLVSVCGICDRLYPDHAAGCEGTHDLDDRSAEWVKRQRS